MIVPREMIVLVEILDERLKQSYGVYHHYELDKALKGEQQGLWRIIKVLVDGEYKDKAMLPINYKKPDKTKDDYLKKQDYQTKALTYKDVYGEEKNK